MLDKRQKEQSLTDLVRESVKSHPAPFFTVAEIIEDVRKIRPNANKGTLSVVITRDLKKQGLVEVNEFTKGGRGKNYRLTAKYRKQVLKDKKSIEEKNKSPEFFEDTETKAKADKAPDESNSENRAIEPIRPGEITFAELGESMYLSMHHLKTELTKWKIKYSDLEVKLKNQDKEWRSTLREKDKTIESLNKRISGLNQFRDKKSTSFPLAELMTEKKQENKHP